MILDFMVRPTGRVGIYTCGDYEIRGLIRRGVAEPIPELHNRYAFKLTKVAKHD